MSKNSFFCRSRDFFPKASAKVRTFCGLTKYLRHFFAASKHFSRFNDQSQRNTPFYLFARAKEGRNKGKEQERSSGGDASGQREETGARRNGENGEKEGRKGGKERRGQTSPHGRRRGKHDARTQAGESRTDAGGGKHDAWTGKEEMDGEVGKKGGEALIIIKYGWLGDDYGGVYVSYFKKLY